MKILVTGAAGFIGFFVSQALLARGDEVVGIDNLNDYYDPRLKSSRLEILQQQKNFRFVKLDVADRRSMETRAGGAVRSRKIQPGDTPGGSSGRA